MSNYVMRPQAGRYPFAAFAVLACFNLLPLRAATNTAPVRVHVRAAGGALIRNAYVALVPVWRPLSRPLLETVAENGIWIALAPAGNYRLIAGANRFREESRAVSVTADNGADLTIELHPLQQASGNVSDERGNPIAGVRIATVSAAIAPPLGTMSRLAADHLGSDWFTTTAKNGNWTLALPAGTTPLLYEKTGYAAEWRLHKQDDPAALDVTLKKGAALHLIADRSDSDLVVTMVREDSNAGSGVPSDWQRQIWARWASTTTLSWDSLQPGTYSIYAKYPNPKFFMQRAAKIGTVTLAPLESRELPVTLPSALVAAKSVATLFVEGATRKDVGDDVQAFGVSATGAPQRIDLAEEEASGGLVFHLKDAEVRPPFSVVTPNLYVATFPDIAGAGNDPEGQPLRGIVHPRADAHLELHSAEKDVNLPLAGKGVLRNCGKVNRVTVAAEIRQGKLARFTAPAACANLTLFFDPFEPIIIETRLKPGDQSLGRFVLRAAATADIHVVRDPGGEAVPGATVRVAARSEAFPRATVLIDEAVTGDDGWTHFSRLPLYRDLRVTAQSKNDEKSLVADLRLEPHGHAVVDPLAIPKPAELTVDLKLDPEFRARFPAAQIFKVSLHPSSPSIDRTEDHQQILKDETSVHFAGLTPGIWRIRTAIRAASTHAEVDSEDIELKTGETRRYLNMVKPLVFEGHVSAKGTRVPSRVTILDAPRTGTPRLYVNSDANGVFYAMLAVPGIYSVEVARLFRSQTTQGVEFPVGEVDFSDPGRPVEIEIPQTHVVAHVRESERPVEQVLVSAVLRRDGNGDVQLMEPPRMVTDSNGQAIFDNLMPGTWTFAVRDKDTGRGAEKTMTIKEGDDASVVLDLQWTTAIKGIVRDPGGTPLPFAHIDCAYTGVAGATVTAAGDSDGEGKFSVDISTPAPAAAFCSVIGPMGGVDAFVASPNQTLDVTTPASAGTLQIPDWYQQQHPGMFWLGAADGRIINLSAVAAKLGRFGGPLVIAGLASGRWKLLRIESMSQWAALGAGMSGSLRGMADLVIDAGATQTVKLYGSSANSAGK
jgi:hypothetical protein